MINLFVIIFMTSLWYFVGIGRGLEEKKRDIELLQYRLKSCQDVITHNQVANER
jgi:hypothetical protein